jgi:hypothetical protein
LAVGGAGAFLACWWLAFESVAISARALRLAGNVRNAERISPDALTSRRRERYRWGVFSEFLGLIAMIVVPLLIMGEDSPSRHRVGLLVLWVILAMGVRLARTRGLIGDGILD